MGATYTRQSSSAIVDGGVIEASEINAEFNQILAAFAESSGHTHDGTSAEGGPITKLLGTAITIGDATSGTDIAVTFDGESADGVLTWMEDEDYFQFSDDLLLTTTEKLQFRDTAIYINSSADGQLDLVADTEIQIAATTIDINGAVDISGTLTLAGTTLAETISDTVGAMVSSNTETGITVTYEDGDNTLDFALGAAQTTITSLLATDIKIGEDDQTKIDFETADEIHFYAANVEQVYLGDNIFGPQSDSDVDLGSTGVRWKDAFIDTITTTGNVTIGGDLTVTGDDITMGTNTSGHILVADGTNFNPVAVGDLSEISTVANDDVFLAVDTSGGGLKKIARSAVVSGLAASGAISNVADDSTPQLGGNLDTNSHNILIDDAHFIADENGNEQLIFQTTSSAVNQFDVTNAATGNAPEIASTGGDTNIDLKLTPKGSGKVVLDGNVSIDTGVIDLKNGGTASKILFYCESSNAHAQTLQSAAHSVGATNTLTLPGGSTIGNSAATLVSDIGTQTLTNKTLTTPVIAEIDSGADITLDATADIVIDAAGGNVEFKDAGTLQLTLDMDGTAGAQVIQLGVDSDDLIFKQYDGTTVLTLDDDTTVKVATDLTVGDDLSLISDSAVLKFGADGDTTLTHTDGTGLTLNSTNKLCFNDATQFIQGASGTVLDIAATDEIELTATLIDVVGNLAGSGTGTFGGILKTDDTTEATSTTDGSLQTDGGLSVAKDGIFGDDITLLSDSAVLKFGADAEVTLTHVHNDGLLLNTDMQLQFRDSAINIRSDADGDLDINADDEVEINSTLIDVNGNLDVSGTLAQAGVATFSAAANVAQQAITSSSNAVAWDASAKPNAYHQTSENTTFSAPSNAVEGAFIVVEINYNGSHTIAWNTVFEFAASTAFTATSTDGKTDIIVFRYNGSVWQEVGRTLNLSES